MHVTSKVSATPTLSACEAENSAAVAVTKEVLDTYLVFNSLQVHTPGSDLVSNALTKRVTEEEQVWSSEDMRGGLRRYSQVDTMPHIPIMRSDHVRMWPLISCAATTDYEE